VYENASVNITFNIAQQNSMPSSQFWKLLMSNASRWCTRRIWFKDLDNCTCIG